MAKKIAPQNLAIIEVGFLMLWMTTILDDLLIDIPCNPTPDMKFRNIEIQKRKTKTIKGELREISPALNI